MNMKLEVVIVPVSDVDRAKAFYEKLGFRLDIDIVNENFRGIQFTPPRSEASIIFGKGVTSARAGSADLVLAVDNLDAAREDLISCGVKVSEVFHYAGGPFNHTVANPRVGGRDPEGRSYYSFASFEDPDGNGWLLQEVTTRLPGREWDVTAKSMDVATLAELLHETSEHHDHYEKTHAKHNWWDWYAPYLSARQNGSSPDEAAAAADRYMEERRK
jgi:catechol 2,3-dioxygenase-like lactoylglutathione lyase family enzyme